MPHDYVTLTVPAKSEYALAVRMTASALVAHRGLSYEKVDEVRWAAEEAFIYAVETLAPSSSVTFEFALSSDQIEIQVALGGAVDVTDEEFERAAGLTNMVLEAVCDECDVDVSSDGSRSLRLRLAIPQEDADDA